MIQPSPRRLLSALARAGAALLLGGQGGTALAHASYIRSTPAADSRLVKAPGEISVVFSETPDARSSEIAVLDVAGRRVDRNDTSVSVEPNGLRVSLTEVGEGGYLVAWTAVSTVDGHTTKGSFAFAVGNAPLPQVPDVPDAIPAPTPLEIVGRLLSFGGVALALGVILFGAMVHEPSPGAERRREAQLLIGGGVLLVLGTALLVLDHGSRLPARLATLFTLRAAAGAIIAGLQLGLMAALLPASARRLVSYAAGLSAALSVTLVSHAAASTNTKQVLVDLAHVVSISAWMGGLVALLWVVVAPRRVRDEADARALGAVIWRFSLFAITAVAGLAVTGTLASLDRLVLVEDLWETPYGLALTVKILLLAVVLLVASVNLLRWGPRLRAGTHGMQSQQALLRGTALETLLLTAVLVAASFLTSFPPPAAAYPGGFVQTRHAGDLRLELLVPQTIPGRNRFVVRVHRGLEPVLGAEKVALRFTMVEHDMGEQELVATERAPGEYIAEGSPTAMYGTWRVETIVRRTGMQDVRSVFEVPIVPPFGQGATARAIALGSYTLVVFTDPAIPTAGAPINLSVVLVDSQGAPLTGKLLRATFEGPVAVTPITAKEATNGRYELAIPALDPGAWRAQIAIGSEGTATYEFEVKR